MSVDYKQLDKLVIEAYDALIDYKRYDGSDGPKDSEHYAKLHAKKRLAQMRLLNYALPNINQVMSMLSDSKQCHD
jgi:hypothetical protein